MYQKHRDVLEVVNGSSAQGGEGELTENELAFDGTTDLALTSQQAVLQHDDTKPSALSTQEVISKKTSTVWIS